jgi:ribosomal protein S12 methylthiotransferase accessory factor
MLHDAIGAALGPRAAPIAEAPDLMAPDLMAPDLMAPDLAVVAAGQPPVSVVVEARDGWDTSGHDALRAAAAAVPVSWLPVRTELSHAVIGPVETAGQAGCARCAAVRRSGAMPDPAAHQAVWRRHASALRGTPANWLTGLGARQVAELVVAEAAGIAGGGEVRCRSALLRVELRSLAVTRHPFLPDPACPVCGGQGPDPPRPVRPVLRSRPARPPGSYRSRDLTGQLDELAGVYADEQVGLVGALRGWTIGGVVLGSARVAWTGGAREEGYGRADTFEAARLTALLEALERYGGAPPGPAVTASFHELGARALDPRLLGLYPSGWYERPGFPFVRFEVDRPYRWVWGWSFRQEAPVLVPEASGFFRAHRPESGALAYECSSGCALGSCFEEAVLYGLLEVAERDAFLLTWYARLPAPRIDLRGDPALRLLAATIEAETGYRVAVFDTTTEQRIPCVWAMAVNPAGDGRPALACAAGCHPDPGRAVRAALGELGPALSVLIQRYADPDTAARSDRLVDDPAQVTTMEDHGLLYANPRAAARLGFLTGGRDVRPVSGMGGPDRDGLGSDDLRDNLLAAVGRYTGCGMDVIVVDQTTPEHRAGGFRCVRVIVPGTLPMTFGHRFRRTHGLPRLREVPRLLGYRDAPLWPEEVNPHPHPFP